MEKKTELIGIRITPTTKKILEKEAEKLEWTISKLAEKILREWTDEAKENKTGSINFIIGENGNINIGG